MSSNPQAPDSAAQAASSQSIVQSSNSQATSLQSANSQATSLQSASSQASIIQSASSQSVVASSTSGTLASPAPTATSPPIISSSNSPSTESIQASAITSSQSSRQASVVASRSTSLPTTIPQQTPLPTASASSSDHRLTNGTVAGIVVGVAVGLAFITFFATFLILRRKRKSGQYNGHGNLGQRAMAASSPTQQQPYIAELKGSLVTNYVNGSTANNHHLPQSADDKSVSNQVRTALDQIELYIENFYRGISDTGIEAANADLAIFDSPYLSAPIALALAQSEDPVPLLKHVLAQSTVASISPEAPSRWSLLPDEFVLLPRLLRSDMPTEAARTGFEASLTRWRMLTTYLRPDPSKDVTYIAQRDRQIHGFVRDFTRAFASWKNPKYTDGDRTRSLTAILINAADLGIWLFSQPSEFQFRWKRVNDKDAKSVAITPALVKILDEEGQKLHEPQILVHMATQQLVS